MSPATALMRTGKNTIALTTAAFDSQPKPNHVTMIGATPTMGSAATKFPMGRSPSVRKGERSTRMATMIAAPQPIT